MLNIINLSILSLIFFVLSCTAKPASVTSEAKKLPEAPVSQTIGSGWQAEWEKTQKEARKEGKLVLYSTSGSDIRIAFSEALKEYGIALDFVSGRGVELSEKILRERRAGIYNVDFVMTGLNVVVTVVKPTGVLQPQEPLLILPEVKDPKLWYRGKLPFADKDRLILSLSSYLDQGIHINTDAVKPGDINSMQDLLSPKWKGKIISSDPTISGRGQNWLSIVTVKLGEEYLKQLAKQDVFLTRDLRQLADWVAKGRYPVGLGVRPGEYQEYKRAGAPITNLVLEEVAYLLPGAGNLGYLDKAPNPYASRVFLNWLLSKKGMKIWSETRVDQSPRIDMPVAHLEKEGYPVRREGVAYFDATTDTWELESERLREFVVKTFSPAAK